VVDAILVDISYWVVFFDRRDTRPEGMLEAARADLARVYAALERDISGGGGNFVCGALSIADLALLPHLVGARSLDVGIDPQRGPLLAAWLKRMRGLPICAADVERAKSYLAALKTHDLERDKIFWRGDRIEWLLARGFHGWFAKEIEERRVLWPGLDIPGGG
jgi:hypothetical protein